jgi:hypothetical protein
LNEASKKSIAAGARISKSIDKDNMVLYAHAAMEGQVLMIIVVNNQTDFGYPERLAWRACEEMANISSNHGHKCLNEKKVKDLDAPLKELLDRYDDPAQEDKLMEVQGKVDETKAVMAQNVERILQNTENLQDLEAKTAQMESGANQFNQQAKKMHRFAACQNRKMMILLCLAVAAVICVIVIPIVITLK